MGSTTQIEWADMTFNPFVGCTKVSPGCDHCYAESWAKRSGLVQWGPHAERRRTSAAIWRQPAKWNATSFYECPACRWRGPMPFAHHDGIGGGPYCQQPECGSQHPLMPARARVFCASLADVFDNEVPPAWRAELFALIAQTPNLDWLVLTKRIGNVAAMIEAPGMQKCGLPHNIWLGASIVNQEEADRDIPKLLAVPAAKRFLSMEPLLGPVDLTPFLWGKHDAVDKVCQNCPRDADCECGYVTRSELKLPALDWVILGGESGPHARPMHMQWARSLMAQCKDAGVAFHMKQLGAQPRGWCAGALLADDEECLDADLCDAHEAHESSRPCDRCVYLTDRKGGDMAEWPEDLRVREFPYSALD